MKNNKSDSLRVFIILAIIFIFTVMGITLYLGYSAGEGKRGTFGDMFGAANALFTGLSFVGLIVTILLQRKDLNSQQEQLDVQNKTNLTINFETSFFNLLNARNNIVSNIEVTFEARGLNTTFRGRELIAKLFSKLLMRTPDIEAYKSVYSHLSTGYRELSLLFRNLFQIIKFVDEYSFQLNLSEETKIKQKYIDILRDQLSDHEIAFLFYECILNDNSLELKNYVIQYGLVDFVKDDLIWKPHKSYFVKQPLN